MQCNGRFSVDSNGHKNMHISSQISSSVVDSKGGVVGGQVNVQNFSHKGELSSAVPLNQADTHSTLENVNYDVHYVETVCCSVDMLCAGHRPITVPIHASSTYHSPSPALLLPSLVYIIE